MRRGAALLAERMAHAALVRGWAASSIDRRPQIGKCDRARSGMCGRATSHRKVHPVNCCSSSSSRADLVGDQPIESSRGSTCGDSNSRTSVTSALPRWPSLISCGYERVCGR